MDLRRKDLNDLQSYIEETDKEITMILQSLQWDQKHLLEETPLVLCQHDANHRIPPGMKESHESECLLRSQGYTKEDQLLPDVLDPDASTVVKLCKEDIRNIINYVSQSDPTFKRGPSSSSSPGPGPCSSKAPPLSAERLQVRYSADERRALHDAVTCATTLTNVYGDFTLPSVKREAAEDLRKSRLRLLAELRDMKRRRVKYRGGGATNKYSHVLRDLIKTQMEMYTGVQTDEVNNSNGAKVHNQDSGEKQQTFDNKSRQFEEKTALETRNYKSEYKTHTHTEMNQSFRKRHSHRDQQDGNSDRKFNHSHDEEPRAQRSKHYTKEYQKEDRSFKDSRREYKDKRRDKEHSSESSRTSQFRGSGHDCSRSHKDYERGKDSSKKTKQRN